MAKKKNGKKKVPQKKSKRPRVQACFAAKRVLAEEIQIINSQGALRAIIGTMMDSGSPQIDFFSKEGSSCLRISLEDDGSSCICLRRGDGTAGIGMTIHADGRIGLGVYGPMESKNVGIGIGIDIDQHAGIFIRNGDSIVEYP
ncbi:MAG: hypothetical protein ACKV0T_16085 [Planctomycetales bacterium]